MTGTLARSLVSGMAAGMYRIYPDCPTDRLGFTSFA